jgi:hypothetical protein
MRRLKTVSTLSLLLVIAGTHSCPCASQESAAGPPPPAGLRVLVDSIHAHNALQPLAGNHSPDYHRTFGFRHAFDYLKSRGVQVDEISSGRLDDTTLAPYRMLFVNLVSADLPPFRVSEITALKSYLHAGGSLLLITDHSNCYYHAYKLLPLLEELGLEVYMESATEEPPLTLGDGNAWIMVRDFVPHPVTAGLQILGMQTAGTVDGRYAVARTSPASWGDLWQVHPYGEGDVMGLFGNWEQDKGERNGPLGVVLAKEVGRGRVVVVADQNMLGNPFINYADNYRLWLNSVAWLTGAESLAEPQPYREWRSPRITAYEQYSSAAFGQSRSGGYNQLGESLCDRLWMFTTDDLSGPQDLIVFAHDAYGLPENVLADLVQHVRSGRNAVMLGEAPSVPSEEVSVIRQICGRLGAPALRVKNSISTYSWPGAGHLAVLPDNTVFRNPMKKQDQGQQTILDSLVQGLAAEATHQGQDP